MWVPRWIKKILEALSTESSTIQEAIKKQEDAIRVYSESSKDEQNEAARIIAGAINNASNASSSYERPQRNKEYGLQKALVILTALAAGGAVTAAIGSLFTLPQVKRSADAAKRAAETSASQLEMAQRPWIEPDVALNSGVTFDESGGQVEFLNTLKNIGNTPAIRTFEEQEIYLSSPARLSVEKERDRFCAQVRPTGIGHTIFPRGQPYRERVLLHIPQSDIDGIQADFKKAYGVTNRFLPAYLISCFAYNSTFNAKVYYSTTVHDLVRTQDPMVSLKIGENVSSPVLVPDPVIGTQAQ